MPFTAKRQLSNLRGALRDGVRDVSIMYNDRRIRDALADGNNSIGRKVIEKSLNNTKLRGMQGKSAVAALKLMKRKDKSERGAQVSTRTYDHTYDVLLHPPGRTDRTIKYRITAKHRDKESIGLIKHTSASPAVYTYDRPTVDGSDRPSPWMFVVEIDFGRDPAELRFEHDGRQWMIAALCSKRRGHMEHVVACLPWNPFLGPSAKIEDCTDLLWDLVLQKLNHKRGFTGGPDFNEHLHVDRASRQRTSREAQESDSDADDDEAEAARAELQHCDEDAGDGGDVSSLSGESGITEDLTGRPGNVFEYTGKSSTRAKYISDRAKVADGLTYSQALQLQYRNRNGEMVAYTVNDLEYDLDHGYLKVASQ